MPSSREYADFIMDQMSGIPGVSIRKMMGEYILYYQEKIFGGIYDDRLLVKITKAGRELMPVCTEEIPYNGGRPMLLVSDVDNRELLEELIKSMYKELPMPRQKKKTEQLRRENEEKI